MRPHAVALLLAVLSLIVHLTLARQFQRVAAFDQLNVLFHADVSTRVQAFTRGRHLGIKHPNLMPYFTPPIALAAGVLTTLFPEVGPRKELRRTLGMYLVPVASGLTTAFVCALFYYLGFSGVQATIATLLALVSFSTLIFGSIPESYGLTALALAIAYAFAARSRFRPTRRCVGAWVAIGVFATGITITNLLFVTLLLWATTWKIRPRLEAATLQVALLAVAILGVTGVSAYVLDFWLVPPESAVVEGPPGAAIIRRVAKPFRREVFGFHLSDDPLRKLRRFPTAVAQSLAPPSVEREPIKDIGRHNSGFTLEASPGVFSVADPLGLAVLILLVAGTAGALSAPTTRSIATASLGILALCWLMSVWGEETHLYSQHWNLAAVVLIAGLMKGPREQLMTVVVGLLTLLVAVNNFLLVRSMLAVLAAVPP